MGGYFEESDKKHFRGHNWAKECFKKAQETC